MSDDDATAAKPPTKLQGQNESKRATGYRLWPEIQPLAEILSKETGDDLTTIVNHAVRDLLRSKGLWPGADLMNQLTRLAREVDRTPDELLAEAISSYVKGTH